MQRQGPATLEGATNRPNSYISCKPSLYSMDSAYPLSINKMRNEKEKKEVFIERGFSPEIGLIQIQKNGSGLSKR